MKTTHHKICEDNVSGKENKFCPKANELNDTDATKLITNN